MKLKLKQLRLRKNLTQDEVAAAIGLTRSGYAKLETNAVTYTPFLRMLKLAKVLGVAAEDLVE